MISTLKKITRRNSDVQPGLQYTTILEFLDLEVPGAKFGCFNIEHIRDRDLGSYSST